MAVLFGVSLEAKIIIVRYFEIITIGYVLNCITQSFMGELNGLQQQIKSMAFLAFYFILLRLPLAKILSSTAFEINGISISIAISFIVPAVIAIVYQNEIMDKRIQKIVQNESIEVEAANSAMPEVESKEIIDIQQNANLESYSM
jgi:Na+-driven multidrug efflux pump